MTAPASPPTPAPSLAPARPRPLLFVRVPAEAAIEADAAVELYLRRWIMTELSGWVQLVILDLLATGKVEWQLDPSPTLTLGSSQGPRLIVVRSEDRRGPRRPGLWAALAVATALAERYAGVVVDPRRELAVSGARERLRAPANGRIQAVDHLCVPSSRVDGRRSSTTVGMAQFGLPDLELAEIPEPLARIGGRLLLGVAQHLIDGAWAPPRIGERPRELLLTVGELCWALGGQPGEVPTVRGRGWTRVAVSLPRGRCWPALVRLGPPSGARRWSDTGAWLRAAWRDLVGERRSHAHADLGAQR